jgi:hypothetical protein
MRLTVAEQRRWRDVAGDRADRYRDSDWIEIDKDEHGRLNVDSTVTCGIYVVVDADDHVCYIGKVHRNCGSDLRDRFRDHHARQDHWDRVWVLPLLYTLAAHAVVELEAAMITYFDPDDNVAGVRGTR